MQPSTSPARRVAAPLVALIGLVLGMAATAAPMASATSPSQRAPLPVPHAFLAGAVDVIGDPGAQLAGANDFSCRPDPARPRPVVLVHGTSGSGTTNWATYGPLLHNAGYCVFSLTYGALDGVGYPFSELGGLQSIPDRSVPQVAAFVDRVLEATGAEQVDLVGHSQGTLVAADVAKRAAPGKVGAVVSLAPLWDGTGGAGMSEAFRSIPGATESLADSPTPALGQLATDSDYIVGLFGPENTPFAPGVRYTNIVTRYDQFIMPFTSGVLDAPAGRPGFDVRNIVLQDGCEQNYADHLAIAAEPRAADLVLGALDPAHAPEPRCEFVLPVHGPTGGS